MSNEVVIRGVNDIEVIKNRIYEVRGQRVMLDRDLAELYNVETKVLNQAVKRNIERFPEDFMFRMDNSEWEFLRSQFVTSKIVPLSTEDEEDNDSRDVLRSQFVTSKDGRGGVRYTPYVFTELGIAMLSSVLRSETAIQVNINIMRAFVAIRHAVSAWQDTNLKVEQLSHKVDSLNARVDEILHEQNENNMEMAVQISALNDALDQLREKPTMPRKRIGFKTENTICGQNFDRKIMKETKQDAKMAA